MTTNYLTILPSAFRRTCLEPGLLLVLCMCVCVCVRERERERGGERENL